MCMIEQQDCEIFDYQLELSESAPDFGIKSLSDYTGKWLLLFSLPSDFSSACSAEFIALIENYARFQAVNCDLLGFSNRDLFSQIAWVRNVRQKSGIEIPFPIAADCDGKLGLLFGMQQRHCENVTKQEGVFIIDDYKRVRALLYDPKLDVDAIPELINLIKHFQGTRQSCVAVGA